MQSARDDALAAERIRQQGYDREAQAVNARSQGQYEDYGQKQDTRAKELGDYFQQQTAAPTEDGGPTALPQSGSNITVQAENKARTAAKKFTDQQGLALGNLRSFGDLLGEFSRNTARDAGYIGQIGGFKKGSSAVLPYELEAANSKGAGMKTLGDVLGGLGKIGVSAGLSGVSPFGTAAVTNFTPGTANGAFGAGGYTGMGPFTTVPSAGTGLYKLFG